MIKIHLSRILGEKRMSQAELSRQTGIRPSTINDIYNEMSDRLNVDHLDRICEYLDCTITDLIEYIPNDVYQRKRNEKTNNKNQYNKNILATIIFENTIILKFANSHPIHKKILSRARKRAFTLDSIFL